MIGVDMTALDDDFAAIDRLRARGRFVEAWGSNDAARLRELEALLGGTLPADFHAFLLRYSNLNLGYRRINGLGPVANRAAACTLTLDRRGEWPCLPQDALVLGEEDTDMFVLRAEGSVEVRTECTRDLAVTSAFPTFREFLIASIRKATEDAKGLGLVPEGFDAWR